MNKTGIEYLDYTWNPIAMLCNPVSAGCQKCWHRTRAKMLANNPMIPEDAQKAYAGHTGPLLIKSRLEQPRKVKKPSMIGVQFMGDLFHEDVLLHALRSIFFTIYSVRQHKYLILTKRPKNMALAFERLQQFQYNPYDFNHVWLGVTVEHPDYLHRINDLLQIPAAMRLVSVEPMLEAVDLSKYLIIPDIYETEYFYAPKQHLHWVICGPETGPGARECKPEWIEDLYEQCKAAGVPFFDKRKNYLAREFPKC